jgi:hypothetical protein
VDIGKTAPERKLSKVDEETRNRIIDFFEGFELIEFLQLPVEEVVDAFEAEIEEALDEIEELMQVRRRKED